MGKRTLLVDWVSVNGARKKKRKLSLECDAEGIYDCPVSSCMHSGFRSIRGCRMHVTNKHAWWYYFDVCPEITRSELKKLAPPKHKATTHNQLAFSIVKGCGRDFVEWLQTACGGCKTPKQSTQTGRRAMKFLMACVNDFQQGDNAERSLIDCCICSPGMLMEFLKILGDWGLQSAGQLTYLHSISDLCDFRKCSGELSDDVLRSLAITEVYLRRSKATLYKKKNMEYSRNLDLETLISKNSWATIDEIEMVVPFHTEEFKEIIKAAQKDPGSITISDIAFATRFLITFLFLRVKCTRPMSIQYLTLDMIENAPKNDYFIDQSLFKTAGTFAFDSLKFNQDTLEMVNIYITHIRPLCKPKPECNLVILTNNGTPYNAIGAAMSILVYQAIKKHISPTRYRMIIESLSKERLCKEDQEIMSQDQKHNSYTAKRSYQKKLSKKIAADGAQCMTTLVGDGREKHTSGLVNDLRSIVLENNSADPEVQTSKDKENDDDESNDLAREDDLGITECSTDCNPDVNSEDTSKVSDVVTIIDEDSRHAILSDHSSNKEDHREIDAGAASNDIQQISVVDDDSTTSGVSSRGSITQDDIEVKREEIEAEMTGKRVSFTRAEDEFLRTGLKKHWESSSVWAAILADKDYKFKAGRTRDSLRVRANSLKLNVPKKKSKKKQKLTNNK